MWHSLIIKKQFELEVEDKNAEFHESWISVKCTWKKLYSLGLIRPNRWWREMIIANKKHFTEIEGLNDCFVLLSCIRGGTYV